MLVLSHNLGFGKGLEKTGEDVSGLSNAGHDDIVRVLSKSYT